MPSGYEIKYPHEIVRRHPSQGSQRVLARLPQVVEGGSEGYVVGILPAGGSWKVRRCDQAMTKQPFWFRDICRHTLYIYIYLCSTCIYICNYMYRWHMYVYFCIYIFIYMEVYGWVVDTELEISAQVSGPIGLQVGKVQLDLVSWPFGLRCGQIAFSIQQKQWNDEHPWLFLEMIYFYEFYIVLRWIFPSKKYVYWRVATETLDISMFFFFFPQNMGIMGYLIIKAYPGHIYTYIIIYLVSLMNVGDCYCRL